ncbi:MAG: helix-turn-helix domain containing protein [Flavisolibacter sp.]|nr:helix-turn-helix domain containing protein [Flavisolibacter sp.]
MSRNIRQIELSAEECHLLKEGYGKGSTHAFRKRCHVVLLKAEGRSSKDIGRIVAMHEVSVNNWLNRYEAEGIAGLLTKEGRGRKPLLNDQQDARIVRDTIAEERQRLSKAKELLEQRLGKTFSQKTLKRFLKTSLQLQTDKIAP